jgi:hypothetical protein
MHGHARGHSIPLLVVKETSSLQMHIAVIGTTVDLCKRLPLVVQKQTLRFCTTVSKSTTPFGEAIFASFIEIALARWRI